jgi:hypothetical protein
MRKSLLLFIPALLLSCLDPLSFDISNLNVDVDLHGNINTIDVTSAVLLMINQSKSTDVTRVEIRQNEEIVVIFENEPKRLTKRAKYLTPGEKSYTVDIDYKFYRRAGEKEYEGEGSKQLVIPLPFPREIVDIFIYRDVSGEVKIGTERELTFDPDDTGDPLDDTLVGQGSSPAVIPPENRSRMAAFVVINRTRSQNIDGVRFEMGQSAYTMGTVRVRDKQSIALGQGTWGTTVTYTQNGSVVTLPAANSIIVPSNDPQAVNEHYLHFYLNNKGRYDITEDWPPGDQGEEDILPPDRGHGRGVIKLINHSDSQVNNLTIINLNENLPYEESPRKAFDYTSFDPPVPVVRNQIGYLDVVGTGDFPIDDHKNYRIDVTVKSGDSESAITIQTRLKDVVVEIVIEPQDVSFREIWPPGENPPDDNAPLDDYGRGVIMIVNHSNSPVNSLTIARIGGSFNPMSMNGSPHFPVPVNQTARIDVIGTVASPIEAGGYRIVLTLANGSIVEQTASIKDSLVTITVEDSRVYAAGWFASDRWDPVYACYWVDGKRINLNPSGAFHSEATGAAASPDGAIYVSGWYEIIEDYSTKTLACYWEIKGTSFRRIELHPAGAYWSHATGIAFANGKVHIIGRSDDSDPYSSSDIYGDEEEITVTNTEGSACYWTADAGGGNIQLKTFPAAVSNGDTVIRSGALAVTAYNNDVYIAGWYSADSYAWSDDFHAFYWRPNDYQLTALPGGQKSAAYAIAVSASGVYTAGMYVPDDEYQTYPCYWEGTTLHDLALIKNEYYDSEYDTPDQEFEYYNRGSQAGGIAVSGSSVYVSGWWRDEDYNKRAIYWINGTRKPFLNNVKYKDSMAHSVTVSGGDVYITGCFPKPNAAYGDDYTVAAYWKNGAPAQQLDTFYSAARAIVVVP